MSLLTVLGPHQAQTIYVGLFVFHLRVGQFAQNEMNSFSVFSSNDFVKSKPLGASRVHWPWNPALGISDLHLIRFVCEAAKLSWMIQSDGKYTPWPESEDNGQESPAVTCRVPRGHVLPAGPGG